MTRLLLAGTFCAIAMAAVVDRIAVVVGKTVITESEVLQEARLTAFLNRQPVDLSPEQRRAAAERLVDQQLIREEMEMGQYPRPSQSEAEAVLRQFRQENYPVIEQFRAALEKYGVEEDELKKRLTWQLTALRFTDARFRMGLPEPAEQSASRSEAGGAPPAEDDLVKRMDDWLKEARARTRVQFKKEAFQ